MGWDKERIAKIVNDQLELVGLDPEVIAQKMPDELSGGEAQRVGVARALAADPPVLLMDEPFGALDPISREHLQREFAALHKRLGKTVVFVTHDIEEAVLLGDRIVLMRDGSLVQEGAPEDLWRSPASEFVRDFFGDEFGLQDPLSASGLRPAAGTGPLRRRPARGVRDQPARCARDHGDQLERGRRGRPGRQRRRADSASAPS